MEMTGFCAVIGSWNTIVMRSPRISRSSGSARSRRLRPSKITSPLPMSALFASRPIAAEITVVFPQPLSPTTPTTLFRGTLKLTPRTACTGP